MDTLKQKILTIIEKNSRIDMKELAVLLGTGEIEIINAMQEMQDDGIICGYHTMIDWEKTGIERVTALIEVRVTPQRGKGFDDIAERIYKYPEVDCTYLISGGYDLMVILEGKTLKEVFESLEERGYNPTNQIVGYLISGDPGYISSYKDARNKIQEIDRAKIVEILLNEFQKHNK